MSVLDLKKAIEYYCDKPGFELAVELPSGITRSLSVTESQSPRGNRDFRVQDCADNILQFIEPASVVSPKRCAFRPCRNIGPGKRGSWIHSKTAINRARNTVDLRLHPKFERIFAHRMRQFIPCRGCLCCELAISGVHRTSPSRHPRLIQTIRLLSTFKPVCSDSRYPQALHARGPERRRQTT